MGDACPIPVVKTLRALKELNGAGTVQTLVDNRAAVENLTRLAESKGCAVETEQLGEKEYRVTITAGEDAELRGECRWHLHCSRRGRQHRGGRICRPHGRGRRGAVPACRSAGADDPCSLSDRGGLRSGVEGAAAGAGRALHRIGHSSRRS